MWQDADAPDPQAAKFDAGAVTAKLLFTAATAEEVPYLEGAPEWVANAHVIPPEDTACQSRAERAVQTLRLLQVDIAVRDDRADQTTGWLFGTFVYDSSIRESDPWKRLRPVGLMWGNDPDLNPEAYDAGERVQQSWINPELDLPIKLGWLGRLNGPVDNPASSCLSCHGTAQIPVTSPMAPQATFPDEEKMRWFRNITAGEPFDPGGVPTDYSLQLSMGIQNHEMSQRLEFAAEAPSGHDGRSSIAQQWLAEIGEADSATIVGAQGDLPIYRITRGE